MVEQTNTTGFKTGMYSVHWVYIGKHFVLCNASKVCSDQQW